MKSPGRIAALLLGGFLAFAPPGTLIFGFMIILGFVGNVWLVVGGGAGLIAVGVTWLLIRKRASKKTNLTGPQSEARVRDGFE